MLACEIGADTSICNHHHHRHHRLLRHTKQTIKLYSTLPVMDGDGSRSYIWLNKRHSGAVAGKENYTGRCESGKVQ